MNSDSEIIFITIIIFFIQCFVAIAIRHINRPFMWELGIEKWISYFCPLFRLGEFLIGCCFGFLFKNNTKRINFFVASIAETITIFAVIVSVHFAEKGEGLLGANSFKHSVIYVISSVLLVYLFALNSGIYTRLITNRVTVYLGNISGYAFLIHAILITYLTKLLYVSFPITNNFFKFSFELVLTIIASGLYSLLHKFVLKKLNYTIKGDK